MLAWFQGPGTVQFNKFIKELLEEKISELVNSPRKFMQTTHYEQIAAELVDNSDLLRGQIIILQQLLELEQNLKNKQLEGILK